MPKIRFIDGDQVTEVEAENGQSILQIALDNGIPIEHACGGNGFCTTCLCDVRRGMENLAPRTDREEAMDVTEDPYRLSCQTIVNGDVTIKIVEN